MRERFEQWAESKGYSTMRKTNPDGITRGRYISPVVEFAWQALEALA
ncbi:MAG: hypothetical protein K0Q92_655 [Steroidobacteraceae bacterium]|jgi:hypothetical protein|nr:hypothetical protein [Steroidobacteraceae bacterium]